MMRKFMFIVPVVVLMSALAACSVSTEDADDDSVSADATETPVMDSQQTDDADVDDATDDAADDSVTDDSATDDATDDAVDDATDDAADDSVTDDSATDDAVDDAADDADNGVTDDEEVAEPVEHTIDIGEDNDFSPAEITIAPGDTVTWVNNTDMVHTSSADPEIVTDPSNVQLPDGAEAWHSGNIEPGEEYSVTLDVPGVYVYFCYPHQDDGMIGTIIVEDAEHEVETDDPGTVDDDAVDDDAVTDDDDAVDDDAVTEDDDAVDDDAVTDDDEAVEYDDADDDPAHHTDDDDYDTEEVPAGVGGDRQYNGKDSTN